MGKESTGGCVKVFIYTFRDTNTGRDRGAGRHPETGSVSRRKRQSRDPKSKGDGQSRPGASTPAFALRLTLSARTTFLPLAVLTPRSLQAAAAGNTRVRSYPAAALYFPGKCRPYRGRAPGAGAVALAKGGVRRSTRPRLRSGLSGLLAAPTRAPPVGLAFLCTFLPADAAHASEVSRAFCASGQIQISLSFAFAYPLARRHEDVRGSRFLFSKGRRALCVNTE